jgi:hypothetical protein
MNSIPFTDDQYDALIRALVTARSAHKITAADAAVVDNLLNHVCEHTHRSMHSQPLIEAYHKVYDVKDAVCDDPELRYEAYQALQKIAALMSALDIDVPTRYDRQQQPAT